MRKLSVISLLLIFYSATNIKGQDSENKMRFPWSVSLSYSPKFEIRRPLNSFPRTFFKGFNISSDHKIYNHFSVSLGLNYNQKTENFSSRLPEGANPGPMDVYWYTSFIELPIQLNYHLRSSSNKLDPYIKTSFRNIFYHTRFYMASPQYPYTESYDDYYIFSDLGFGTYLNLKSRLSLMFQTSFGVAIKYHTRQYNYFEGLVGLRYTLGKQNTNP
jgi:hypothetical protein